MRRSDGRKRRWGAWPRTPRGWPQTSPSSSKPRRHPRSIATCPSSTVARQVPSTISRSARWWFSRSRGPSLMTVSALPTTSELWQRARARASRDSIRHRKSSTSGVSSACPSRRSSARAPRRRRSLTCASRPSPVLTPSSWVACASFCTTGWRLPSPSPTAGPASILN